MLPEPYRIQSALLVDYFDNVRHHPEWQRHLERHQPKALIVWGKKDPLFLQTGARAYLADLPKAQLHRYNTGHFALKEDASSITQEIMHLRRHVALIGDVRNGSMA